jgi:sialate O-acetylesterase
VAKKSSLDPSDDVTGKWELCTPETARDFSAVGYFFAKDIRQDLHKPVGLIGSYWGGSPAQAWTSISGLQKRPELKHYVADVEKTRADFSKATAAYPAAVAKYQTQVDAWTKSPDGTAYTAAYKAWRDVNNKAKEAGQDSMRAPGTPKSKPKPPVEPDGGYKSPVVVYNGMIAPLIPYAIKGVIWYQGEENGHKGYEYRALFPNMISDWREKWGQGDFPFIFVQLPNYNESVMQVWPFLREAQAMTLSLPNTGMATGIDVGDPKNIHPQDKVDIGHRVALVARHVAYNEQLVYTGPTYGSMKIEGNSIHVTYTTKGSDLVIGKAPWVAPGAQPRPTDKLLGFTITGDDKKWAPANATISGDEVIVSSPQVPKPVAVRYNWANAPEGNLYNKAGLPAFPFRSDNWSDPAAGIGQP